MRGNLSAQMTLSQFFDAAFVPLRIEGRQLDEQTRDSYQESMRWWVRLTDDPPLKELTDFTCAKFMATLAKQPGRNDSQRMAGYTLKKHARQIQTVIQFAGPRRGDRRGRANQELIDRPPYLEAPRVSREPPKSDYTLAELRQILATCDTMKRPRIDGVKPCDWWQSLIEVALYTGLRRGALMQLEYSMLEDSLLRIPARISKGRRGKIQYVHPDALKAIERIRTDRCVIFQWPNWPANSRGLNDMLRRLVLRAGLPDSRWFGFQGFRRAHLTLLAEVSGHDGMAVAQASAGHSAPSITRQHYVNGDAQLRMVARQIERIPMLRTNGHQLGLFG